MTEFFALSMSTIIHKCQDIVENLSDDADPLEATINLPVPYSVDTDRTRVYLVPGNDKSPLGFIHKEGELKEAFGKQACAEFNILEIMRYYSTFVVDRTEEEVDQAMREYEEAHRDD